jgi:hypothetical protein
MRSLAAVIVAVGLAVASVGATLVVPADFRQVVTDAGLIVRGRVTDVRAVAVRGVGVDSIVTVAVEGVVKGQADTFVSVRVPGGEIGRYRYVMVGAPTFRVGQRAVFFLKRGADNFWRPVGLTMGVYRVQAAPVSGAPVVQPPLVAGRTASATGPAVRGDTRRRLMPVAEFESLVRLVMAMPPGQAVPRRSR